MRFKPLCPMCIHCGRVHWTWNALLICRMKYEKE